MCFSSPSKLPSEVLEVGQVFRLLLFSLSNTIKVPLAPQIFTHVNNRAKLDLGRATSDVTLGTGLNTFKIKTPLNDIREMPKHFFFNLSVIDI